MTSGLAVGIVLLLFAIPLSAIAVAARRPTLLAPVGVAVSIAVVGIAFSQTGTLQRGSLASTDVVKLLPAEPFKNRCQQTFDLLIEDRIVLAPPTPEGMVVVGELWDRLPAPVQDAVRSCALELVEPKAGAEELPIIRR